MIHPMHPLYQEHLLKAVLRSPSTWLAIPLVMGLLIMGLGLPN